MADRWMVCSACRKDIPFASLYYACSVSTCNRTATRLVFCSVPCWDSHVAVLRHRDAWAVEEHAPSSAAAAPAARAASPQPAPSPSPRPIAASPQPAPSPPPRPIAASPQPTPRPAAPSPPSPAPAASAPPAAELRPADESDILVVVSKLKKYIRDRSGMNTSDTVAERLSDRLRALCDAAIRTAAQDGRKTVLDRDVPSVRR